MMVEPERDVPGTRESTWKQPMPNAVFHEMSSMRVMRPKSVSSSAGCATGAAPAKWRPCLGACIRTPSARSERLWARQFSMMMNAMP